MNKIELNLENPIFVLYIDNKVYTEKSIEKYIDFFEAYSNITFWILPSDRTELKCVFDGKYRNRDKELHKLIEKINDRINILSNSKSYEDFKINIRDWRIEKISK